MGDHVIQSRPVSTVEYAYGKLSAQIMTGDLPPGVRIDPADVADRLGISVTPVREALVRLQGDGLVEIVPRRGTVVAPLPRDGFSELYELRRILEKLACEFIIRNITDGQIQTLESLLSDASRYAESDRLPELRGVNQEFHRILYSACGNRYLATILSDLRQKSSRYIYHAIRLQRDVRQHADAQQHAVVEPGHHMILAALKRRDIDSVLKAVDEDIDRTIRSVQLFHEIASTPP